MTTNTVIDLGNEVPAICEQPECDTVVHRGVVHICGMDPTGANGMGCGLQFCGKHLSGPHQNCDRCAEGTVPYTPKEIRPDFPDWRMTGAGWEEWRKAHPDLVQRTYGKHMAKLHHPDAPASPPANPASPPQTPPGPPETPPAPPNSTGPANPPAPPATPPAGPQTPPAPPTTPTTPAAPGKPTTGSAKP